MRLMWLLDASALVVILMTTSSFSSPSATTRWGLVDAVPLHGGPHAVLQQLEHDVVDVVGTWLNVRSAGAGL